MDGFNQICITGTAATILSLLNIWDEKKHKPPMASPVDEVIKMAAGVFSNKSCDRIFMYNPDAVAMWIYEKYSANFAQLENRASLKLPMLSVVPPVTPVCFASMYSGLMPAEHGIMKYEKPVLRVKTVFDVLAEEGKRVAIVSTKGDSISEIFLERSIDYFIYPSKEECNSRAMELIRRDEHDVIILYNGDYDYYMHRFTPEGRRPLSALKENINTYNEIYDAVSRCWKKHNSTVAFASDHGCHRTCLLLGSHGIEKPCDMNVMHFYGFIPEAD